MRIAFTLAVLVGLCYAAPAFAQAKVTLGVNGVTNEKDAASVVFVVSDGKLAAKDWFVSIVITKTYKSGDVATTVNGGTNGEIQVLDNIKAGVYEVKLTVKLNDDSVISDTRNVTFTKTLEEGPPGPFTELCPQLTSRSNADRP